MSKLRPMKTTALLIAASLACAPIPAKADLSLPSKISFTCGSPNDFQPVRTFYMDFDLETMTYRSGFYKSPEAHDHHGRLSDVKLAIIEGPKLAFETVKLVPDRAGASSVEMIKDQNSNVVNYTLAYGDNWPVCFVGTFDDIRGGTPFTLAH
jgi:hypothetical protein